MPLMLRNYRLQPSPGMSALSHLPGSNGWPVVGQSFEFLSDPLAYARRIEAAYGPVSRTSFLLEPRVNLISAEANERVLQDRDRVFSAWGGWDPILGLLFPRGLMLRDGDDHRYHRRLMQPAFRKEALAGYLDRMTPRIVRTIHQWRQRPAFHFYPAIKRLTLELAADVFLGLELQAEVDQVSRDFTDVVEASAAVNRLPWIGLYFARGLRARQRLERFLRSLIPSRRSGNGGDLFTQLCQAEDESGNRYADQEIVDHLIFLMMAAHDTTTSALTTIVYALAREPSWQQRLRDVGADLSAGSLRFDDLHKLEPYEWVLRESLRLYPPLTIILRRATQDFEIHGFHIPAKTSLAIFPVLTARLPQWWSEPERFDPERFSAARAEHRRHAFAWVPFGGGVHMCLGLHFAEMQVKAILHPLLQSLQVKITDGYTMPYQLAPIAKPRDGLPIQVESLH